MRLKHIFLLCLVFLSTEIMRGQGCSEPAEPGQGASIIGFLQPQVDMNLADETSSSFYFNRARIGVAGTVEENFSYYFLLETSAFKKDNPFLLDAFVSYNQSKWLKVSMGSFKSPFGLELSTPCNGLHTINRSAAIQELTAPDRNIGLMLLGGDKESRLEYRLAVTNGTGLGLKDNNMFKDVTGRVVFHPLPILSVGGSVKYGQYAPADPSIEEDDTRMRFGGDLEMFLGNLRMQAEYIYGKDEGSSLVGGGCGSDPTVVLGSFKKQGGFIMAMYDLTFKFQPVVKVDFFDDNLDRDNTTDFVTTAGFNYFFNDKTRLQLNYQYSAEQPVEKKNDAIIMQVQIKF